MIILSSSKPIKPAVITIQRFSPKFEQCNA
jgi:hypothetical protein